MNKFRILVVDDDPSLHEDIRLYLSSGKRDTAFEEETEFLFGSRPRPPNQLPEFDLQFAFQGKDGITMAREALEAGEPFSVGFVDMRMPPGWDGLETIERLWELDPEMQVVLCTAYSDHTWQEIAQRLVHLQNLLILRKPYDKAEVRQMACALSTKRKLNQLATLKSDDLARMVADRTKELEAARQMAEAADRVKTNFLATMAHEMRTPLNSILGLLDLMSTEEHPSHTLEQLRLMDVSGQSLVSLINQVLEHGKLEAGRESLQPTIFHLSEFLLDLAQTHSVAADRKGLALTTEFLRLPDWVSGDRDKLGRVLTNLLSNAVSYTATGQIKLRVVSDEEGVTFEVHDTGSGIAAEELGTIFEPYHQATRLDRHTSGTGLGLAISRRLVEVMSGKLRVESLLGRGSTFWFTIPLSEVVSPPPPEVNPSELVDLSGCTVLLVEDDPVSRRVAKAMLTKLGAEVTVASQGKEAIETLESTTFDMVLLDLRMPIMDGYETIARIRNSSAAFADILVVALTAEAGEVERRRCMTLGMDGYIQKPVRLVSLSQAIWDAKKRRSR